MDRGHLAPTGCPGGNRGWFAGDRDHGQHACGPEKIADFRSHGLASIEIDLSASRTRAAQRGAGPDARRSWLFHPGKAEADARFAVEEAERERLARERAAELQRGREAWAVAKAARQAAEDRARDAEREEERRRWRVEAEARAAEQRKIRADAQILLEAERREQEIRIAEDRRYDAELQIAAARSAVLVWEEHWGNPPRGSGRFWRAPRIP